MAAKGATQVELSAEDELLVQARASGLTHAEVGRLINRSERTARRRATQPEVAEAIRRRRAETAERAVGLLSALLEDAINAMGSSLGEAKPADRLRAANLIVSSFLRLRDQVEMDVELRDMRDALRRLSLDDGEED